MDVISRRMFWCLCVGMWLTLCGAPQWATAQAADADAESVKGVFAPLLAEYSAIFMGDGGPDCIEFALSKNMVSKELKTLLQKELATRKKNDIGNLDFDFLFSAQDHAGKPLAIVGIARKGNAYIMKVDTGFDGVDPVPYVIIKEGDRWVLDDVLFEAEGVVVPLKKMLKG